MKVSLNVRRQIRRFLPVGDVRAALVAMESADLPFVTGMSDRIQFAILVLARGDFDRFKSQLNRAQLDWRDTLVAAGLANEDWPACLAKVGIEFALP